MRLLLLIFHLASVLVCAPRVTRPAVSARPTRPPSRLSGLPLSSWPSLPFWPPLPSWLALPATRDRLRATAADAGMSTAEYAVGTLAAVAFAGVLYAVVSSSATKSLIASVVQRALSVSF